MRITFIFAHPDDEALSVGGTIAKYAHNGNEVSTICLVSDNIRKKEYLNSTKILGVQKPVIFNFPDVINHQKEITENVINCVLDFKPDIIVTHLENDYHIDHRVTYNIVCESIEWAAHETQYDNPHLVSKLYVTETTILLQNPHILVDISDFYDIKEEAIRCYKSQLYKGGNDFYLRFHKYRTLMRGTQASTQYAEAFSQIPLKKNSPFYKQKHTEL